VSLLPAPLLHDNQPTTNQPNPIICQVYDGSHADWTETDRCSPVNAYGRSKLEAEQYVRTHWCALMGAGVGGEGGGRLLNCER